MPAPLAGGGREATCGAGCDEGSGAAPHPGREGVLVQHQVQVQQQPLQLLKNQPLQPLVQLQETQADEDYIYKIKIKLY